MAKIGLNVAVGANISEFSTKMQSVQRTLKKNQDVIKRYAAATSAIMVTIGIASVKAAADMEVMRNRLQVAFNGSQEAAGRALTEITKFTATTPFQLEEVADGFLKLKNLGLDPSIDSLRSYGNTASAMGKSLNQMIEAVADASVGEFERLKEFGIKAKSEGDKVSFTFQGVTTTVGKNSKEIQEYLLNIGNTNFAGSIDKQSQTLYGQLSTLKDNVKLLAAEFGQVLLPAIKEMVSWLTKLADRFGGLRRVTEQIEASKMMDVDAMLKKIELLEAKLNRWGRRGTKAGDAIEAEIANLREAIKVAQKFAGIKEKFAKPAETIKEAVPASPTRRASRGGLVGEMESVAMSADIFGDRIAAGLTELPEKLNAVKGGFINLGRTIDDEILMRIQTMNDMVRSFVIDTIANIADAIGNALAGGGFKDFGKEMLNNLATFLSQFGKMLLLYGIGIEAWIKDLNPATKIAAGVALIAISGAIKGHLSKSSSAMTGGASSSGVASGGGTLTAVIRGGDLYLMTEEYSKRRK